MWIFTKDGFFSAVENWDNKRQLIIRARFRVDLENLNKVLVQFRKVRRGFQVFETMSADYPFRIYISKNLWGRYLANAGRDIDYPNFKGTVDKDRHDIYMGVWSHLRKAEQPRPRKQATWWMTVVLGLTMLMGFATSGLAAERKTTKIYDRNWKTEGYVRDGKIYDKDWNTRGYIKGDRIYDKDWNHKGNLKDE